MKTKAKRSQRLSSLIEDRRSLGQAQSMQTTDPKEGDYTFAGRMVGASDTVLPYSDPEATVNKMMPLLLEAIRALGKRKVKPIAMGGK